MAGFQVSIYGRFWVSTEVQIRPGERHSEELDLSQWFELTEFGNYVIRAEYWNGHPATPRGSPVWTGRATSEAKRVALTR